MRWLTGVNNDVSNIAIDVSEKVSQKYGKIYRHVDEDAQLVDAVKSVINQEELEVDKELLLAATIRNLRYWGAASYSYGKSLASKYGLVPSQQPTTQEWFENELVRVLCPWYVNMSRTCSLAYMNSIGTVIRSYLGLDNLACVQADLDELIKYFDERVPFTLDLFNFACRLQQSLSRRRERILEVPNHHYFGLTVGGLRHICVALNACGWNYDVRKFVLAAAMAGPDWRDYYDDVNVDEATEALIAMTLFADNPTKFENVEKHDIVKVNNIEAIYVMKHDGMLHWVPFVNSYILTYTVLVW